ncbi:MAG: hypothetical protein KatS3mg022_2765 [Armatimonadota bacterium]|nr:MAG: hypothetical protein KatS3mg022_2765 [Armatimonadota bacterium]
MLVRGSRVCRPLPISISLWEMFVTIFLFLFVAGLGPIPLPGSATIALPYINALLVESTGQEHFVYLAGYLILLGLTALSLMLVLQPQPDSAPLRWLKVSATCFFSLYLLDWWISTVEPYPYRYAWQPLCWAIVWHLVATQSDSAKSIRLVKIATIAASIAALYGVIYYIANYNQFVTPGFGKRTAGVHVTPNVLYGISLAALPVSICLTSAARLRIEKLAWGTSSLLLIFGLLFTYTRTGWLAFAIAAAVLAAHPQSPMRGQPRYLRMLLSGVCLLFLLGTLTVRTQGRLVGVPEDRSFHGRFAIFEVAWRVCWQRPFLGQGVASYNRAQQQLMTERLKSFHPMNTEPKNIVLSVWSEHGAVGVCLFLLWVGSLVATHRLFRNTELPPDNRIIAFGCFTSGLSMLVAGIADTPVLHASRLGPTVQLMVYLASLPHLLGGGDHVLSHDSAEHIEKRIMVYVGCVAGVLAAFGLSVALPAVWKFETQLQVFPEKVERRPNVALHEVESVFIDCLIASEDGNFYQHHGVDWQALHRALRVNIRSLSYKQGGSTITMQTARYLFVGREKSLSRKLAEILLALEMEKRLSKERILELYLNSARFGLGAEDIGTACRVYFGKQPKELTLAESAFLAGVLPEPPKRREELTLEKVERCKRRALSRLGYFFGWRYSPEQIERAMREKIVFVWEKRRSLRLTQPVFQDNTRDTSEVLLVVCYQHQVMNQRHCCYQDVGVLNRCALTK